MEWKPERVVNIWERKFGGGYVVSYFNGKEMEVTRFYFTESFPDLTKTQTGLIGVILAKASVGSLKFDPVACWALQREKDLFGRVVGPNYHVVDDGITANSRAYALAKGYANKIGMGKTVYDRVDKRLKFPRKFARQAHAIHHSQKTA